MNEKQKQAIIDLLWDYLQTDDYLQTSREHKDRKLTGWGTKTQAGLIACIERICEGKDL